MSFLSLKNSSIFHSKTGRMPDIRQLPDAGYPATAGCRIAGFFFGFWAKKMRLYFSKQLS